MPIIGNMLTPSQAACFHGIRRIVREIDGGRLIGVALEVSLAHGPATALWLHGDARQVLHFGRKTGKVWGRDWVAERAGDEEVEEALAQLDEIPKTFPRRKSAGEVTLRLRYRKSGCRYEITISFKRILRCRQHTEPMRCSTRTST